MTITTKDDTLTKRMWRDMIRKILEGLKIVIVCILLIPMIFIAGIEECLDD